MREVVQATVGLRVSDKTEDVGLDKTIHGEEGYGIEGALVGHAVVDSSKGELLGVN